MSKIVELELTNQKEMDAVQNFAKENMEYISKNGAKLMTALAVGDHGLFVVGLSKMLADAYTSGCAEQAKSKNRECNCCE